MNKPNLSDIYRIGLREQGNGVIDADTVIAIANGQSTPDAIAASPVQADLIRFSRDLETESAALSSNIEAVIRSDYGSHRRGTAQRTARGQRRWRLVSALAASFVAAIAIWSMHSVAPMHSGATTASVQSHDRIFSALDDRGLANNANTRGDEIFNSSRSSDVIFNAGHNDG
jgi:hypothetical protein